MYLILLVCAGLRALSQESSRRQYAGAETMDNMLFLRVREMRAYGTKIPIPVLIVEAPILNLIITFVVSLKALRESDAGLLGHIGIPLL